MAVKTFTTGEVLTASNTNTYLANAGLVYVTSTTVGSGVSSIVVNNCFSSTYDNYVVMWQGVDVSNTGYSGYFILNGSTGNSYKYGGIYHGYGAGIGDAWENPTGGCWVGIMSNKWSGCANFYRVSSSTTTNWTVTSAGDAYYNSAGGYDTNSAAHTGFTFLPATGTLSNGTITVYGYRKA